MSKIDYTRGFLVINDCVTLTNGMMLDNPFYKDFNNLEMANFLLDRKVEQSIKAKMHDIINDNDKGVLIPRELLSDCYEHVIDYFLRRKNIYKKNYFGKNSDYNIQKYVFSNIKYAMLDYRNKVEQKGDAIWLSKRIVSNGNDEELQVGGVNENILGGTIDNYDIDERFNGSDKYLGTDTDYQIVYKYIENLLISKNYIITDLNINDLIYYYFLLYSPTDKERYKIVKQECNVGDRFLKEFSKDLQYKVMCNEEEDKDFKESLKNLIESNKI